jgi:limonene 1,2-monooxygenase
MGAGAYVQDQRMLGIGTTDTRRMLAESAEVVTSLLRGETVTRESDWFKLQEAQIQYCAIAEPLEIVLANAATPFSVELAAKLQINMMSHGSPPWGATRAGQEIGRNGLAQRWEKYEKAVGGKARREDWRIVLPVHVSDSREAAFEEVFPGWWKLRTNLYRDLLGMPIPSSEIANRKALEYTIDAGGFLLGSVEDVTRAIELLADEVGGFGTLLISSPTMMAEEVRDAGLRKFMKYVAPALSGANSRAVASASNMALRSQESVTAVSLARAAVAEGKPQGQGA